MANVDFNKISTYPIAGRKNNFTLAQMIAPGNDITLDGTDLDKVAAGIRSAKEKGGKVIVMMGGAVIKVGCSDLLIDLMKKGFIDHLAGNGAVSIHDFEVALIGETSENVINGLADGTFGMVEETGRMMCEAVNAGAEDGKGYGRSVAERIKADDLPHKEHSLLYNALECGIPVTIHPAIGGDIIHQHPACDGAALGKTSYEDFKTLTASVGDLKDGALLNIGSAVNMPEVFLKALTIVRNLKIPAENFTVANFDFLDMYRPRTRLLEWPKTLGCATYDIRGNHNRTIPELHRLLAAG